MKKFTCISDTHGFHDRIELPGGDVLLVAGDITGSGELPTVYSFSDWIKDVPYEYKVVIAGNHDFSFEKDDDRHEKAERALIDAGVDYLYDSSITIDGIKIYGAPWQPEFGGWAFNLPRGRSLELAWSKIPEDSDIVITHGPPFGILDKVYYDQIEVGCLELTKRLKAVEPAVHVFGHIHETYGVEEGDITTFINASICTLQYQPLNPPISFFFDVDTRTAIMDY